MRASSWSNAPASTTRQSPIAVLNWMLVRLHRFASSDSLLLRVIYLQSMVGNVSVFTDKFSSSTICC
jgi:hypothetical protein